MTPRGGRADGERRAATAPERAPRPAAGPARPAARSGSPAPARSRPAAARPSGSHPAPRPGRSSRPGAGRRLTASLPAPRGLTRRAAALAVLLLVVAAALAPYLHATITQRAEVAAARAELAETRAEVAELDLELQRWEDPAFVRQQARERLNLVQPGDEPYKVTGTSPSQQVEADPRAAAAASVREGETDRPWFGDLWESVGAAGRGDAG
ncbi:cell division protein FtsB [Pseudokineococcus lusitanus]|uniref:Cell division protein FtsB n=1 Tax=Pseudokineococcus lusitanus TaxID=763993 RepID=A0A3N1HNI0_9ACTN|nr:cell division protein FtsB [Pseudokineococcus lusitanus]